MERGRADWKGKTSHYLLVNLDGLFSRKNLLSNGTSNTISRHDELINKRGHCEGICVVGMGRKEECGGSVETMQ